MRKIVTVIKAFTLNHNVFVYDENEVIDIVQASMNDLENVILSTAEEYDIQDVTLVGPKKFSAGIKARIQTAEMSKYNCNKLNIEIRAN